MDIEIEAKLKVDSIDEVAVKLQKFGAEFRHRLAQTDYYFDDAENSLTQADSCLRLRRELTGETEKIILTFKGPKEKIRLKKRQEIEFRLENADAACKLLNALGYQARLVFEKNRRIWQLDDCEIALDELPLLGQFVEIEGPDEQKIANVQAKLDLVHLPHIGKSYAALMAEKLQKQKA